MASIHMSEGEESEAGHAGFVHLHVGLLVKLLNLV